MTDVWIGLPDRAASGATPNESSAAKTDVAPKLDLKPELDRKREQAPTASGAPRRPRKLRVAATVVALLAILGVGWGAGLKTHEFVSLGQASTWFQDTARALVSNLDVQRKQVMASIEGLASTSASKETVSSEGPRNTADVIEHVARGLFGKIDQVRSSSAAAIGELGMGIERLHKSMERSQRDILAKLDQLQERLERVENAGASSTKQGLEKPASKTCTIAPVFRAPDSGRSTEARASASADQADRELGGDGGRGRHGYFGGSKGNYRSFQRRCRARRRSCRFNLPPRGKMGSRHQQGRDHGPMKTDNRIVAEP
jgi:hypothetical protein